MSLRIGAGLTLPTDCITDAFAIVAKRGAGKTYTAGVMAEEMLKAQLMVGIVDPTGAWWGLKSSADGKSDGFPLVIFGGAHKDVPLEPNSGPVVADFIVDERQPCIIDVSEMIKAEQVRFMLGFCERLYHRNRLAMHLFVDEADQFAPQQPRDKGESLKLLGAIERMIKLGRIRGIGVTLITQRSAVLNKNVLTQADCLITKRLTAPQDHKAIQEWTSLHVDRELERAMLAALPGLPQADAFAYYPERNVFKRFTVREKETFDSSRTPRAGEKKIEPRAFASVDLDKLSAQIKATIERAKADDPKALRAEIALLKKQVAIAKPTIETKIERVEVPVFNHDDLQQIGVALRELKASFDRICERIAGFDTLRHVDVRTVARQEPRRFTPRLAIEPSNGSIGKAHRAILNVLAQRPEGCTRDELGILAGYSPSSGHFANVLGALRTAGYINDRGEPIGITDAGLDALGPFEPLPEGDALLTYWLNHPRVGKAERSILTALAEAGGSGLDRDSLGEASGYSSTSGHFANVLGKLRTLKLVQRGEPIRLSETLT